MECFAVFWTYGVPIAVEMLPSTSSLAAYLATTGGRQHPAARSPGRRPSRVK